MAGLKSSNQGHGKLPNKTHTDVLIKRSFPVYQMVKLQPCKSFVGDDYRITAKYCSVVEMVSGKVERKIIIMFSLNLILLYKGVKYQSNQLKDFVVPPPDHALEIIAAASLILNKTK